jgi:putative glycosyltransferase (TIGR04348 family)
MKIVIVTPAGARSRHGNRNTAVRWAKLLRGLGHRVTVLTSWEDTAADVMIALHARRSHTSLMRFKQIFPDRPLILALTGTDLYRDIRTDRSAQQSLEAADRLIVLQERGLEELSRELRRKARVIYQSAAARPRLPPLKRSFEIVVSGHLRAEKDPFRVAAAARFLPEESRIRIVHMGGAMSEEMEREARAWEAREPRYRWLGELEHWQAMRRLARARQMVSSSRKEGGANVVSEALAIGVPVIASKIPGNVGLLGPDYGGYYPVEDEQALARLLARAESDPSFYRRLEAQCRTRRRLVDPALEARNLARLLREIC